MSFSGLQLYMRSYAIQYSPMTVILLPHKGISFNLGQDQENNAE